MSNATNASVTGPRRPIATLVVSNMLGGIGVATGIAVGTLLVADLGGTELAGVGQALTVLGAALAAVPLASIAARHGRRRALTLGYVLACLGALVMVVGATARLLPVVLAGGLLFGCAQAANLQSRYAASELADPARRGRTMSLVVWATTIGSVLGPNLAEPAAALGEQRGLHPLAGPYAFSMFALAAAAVVLTLLFGRRGAALRRVDADARPSVGALAALAWAMRHPVVRFGVVLLVAAHAVMVAIMSMTPVHLGHQGHGLRVVGLVISLHILGMYALSPVFGWAADRFGPLRTALGGLLTLAAAAVAAVAGQGSAAGVTVALVLLGVGWSTSTIAASVLLAGAVDEVRVPLQGATDALMSYGGAAVALLSGPVLAVAGFGGLALAAGALIVPAFAVGWVARRSRR